MLYTGRQLAYRSAVRSLPAGHLASVRRWLQTTRPRASTCAATDRADAQQLIAAASDGNILAVKRLLARGTLEVTDVHGCVIALIIAARSGHLDVLEALLSAGVNVDACDRSGITALAAAALAGHEDVVAMLLEWGANPDTSLPEVINGVVVYEGGRSDISGGLGAHVWDAAIALSAFITWVGNTQRTVGTCGLPELRDARCLELGAGSGLVGMTLGIQGAHVTCTDSDPALLDLIKTNAAVNGLSAHVRTQVIDWTDPATYLSNPEELHLVAAADTVYKQSGVGFATAVAEHIPPESATPAIIGYQHRDDGTMPFFVSMMEQGFLLERFCDATGRAVGSNLPDDYAGGEFVQLYMDFDESPRLLTPRYKPCAGRLDSVHILRASRRVRCTGLAAMNVIVVGAGRCRTAH